MPKRASSGPVHQGQDCVCSVMYQSHVLQNLDVEYLYEAPLAMEKEHLAQVACECLHLDCPEPDLDRLEEDGARHGSHPTDEVQLLWSENISLCMMPISVL